MNQPLIRLHVFDPIPGRPTYTEPTTKHGEDLTFDELCAHPVMQFHQPSEKNRAPMFSLAVIEPDRGGLYYAAKDKVQALSALVLDADHLTTEGLSGLLAGLAALNAKALVVSSASHTMRVEDGAFVGEAAVRAIVPLSREISYEEMTALLYPGLDLHFGGILDKAPLRNPAQRYFAPTAIVEGAMTIREVLPGEPLDVDAFIATLGVDLDDGDARFADAPIFTGTIEPAADVSSCQPPADGDVTAESLKNFMQRVATSRKKNLAPWKEQARVLHAALDRSLPLSPGSASDPRGHGMHKAILWHSKMLAELIPGIDPWQLEDALRPCLSRSTRPYTRGEFARAYAGGLNKRRVEIGRDLAEAEAAVDAAAMAAFEMYGLRHRNKPHDEEDLALFLRHVERDTFDEIAQRGLVLTCKGGAYVWLDGRYRPSVSMKDWETHYQTILAPWAALGVQLTNEEGEPIGHVEATRRYSMPIAQVNELINSTVDNPRDFEKRELLMPGPSIRRSLRPQHNAEIQGWIDIFGEDFKRWLACVPETDMPAPALLFVGEGGAGKTMLAFALARLYSTSSQPAPYTTAISTFNRQLCAMPLVLADEGDVGNHRHQTATIRSQVTMTARSVEEKYGAPLTLRGSVRFIFAANNKGLFATTEALTEQDIRATAERFVHVKATEEAVEYLKNVPDIQGRWIDSDAFACHVLHLHQTMDRTLLSRSRFCGFEASEEVERILKTGTGKPEEVCRWLYLWATSDDPASLVPSNAERRLFVEVTKEGACVKADPMVLSQAMGASRKGGGREIADAVALLATGPADSRGLLTIDEQMLRTWGERNNGGVADRFSAALRKRAEDKNGTA